MSRLIWVRSLFGEVSGADLADWPISYADLEPYYTKAEYDLGISGLAGANPFEAPRSKPYPLPPMPVNRRQRGHAELHSAAF